jgi:hypothetical protein
VTDPTRPTSTTIPSEQPPRRADELEALEDSFPASDPPTYGQASIGDGATDRDEQPVRTAPEAVPADVLAPGTDPDRIEAALDDPVPDDRGEEGDPSPDAPW